MSDSMTGNQGKSVSIIIPVYNIKEHIKNCIESIFNQTYQDYEIILVDDGSTDGSSEICDKYKDKENIIVIHKANEGAAIARNVGLEHSHSEFVAFIDGDDYISKNYLQELIFTIQKSNTIDIAVCCCTLTDTDESEFFFEYDTTFNAENKIHLIYQLFDINYGQPGRVVTAIGVPWGKLYRRSFLDKYLLRFDPSLRRMQDNLFNMYCFYHAEHIEYINKPLYCYRVEHIMNIKKKYNERLVDNSRNIITARKHAIEYMQYSNNSKIMEFFNREIFGFQREILYNIALYYPDDANRYSYFLKVCHAEGEFEIYKDVIPFVKPGLKWKAFGRKLELQLLKLKLYKVLYWFYRSRR